MIYKYLTRPKIDAQDLAEVNKMVSGFNLIYLYEKKELLHRLLGEIKDLNIAKPHVGHTFPFTKLLDAIRLFQTGKTIGKVVIELTDQID